MKPVSLEARHIRAVNSAIRTAVADGKVSRDERKAIKAATEQVDTFAGSMLPREAAPAAAAAARVEKALARGKLVARSGELIASLKGAISQMKKVEKAYAERTPLDKLPGKWSAPFNGVRTKDVIQPGLRVHLVAVDMAASGVSLTTNSKETRGQTVSSFARNNKAEVAVNGDFFSFGSYQPSGLAMSGGEVWEDTRPNDFEGFIGFSGQHVELVRPDTGKPKWVENAISSRPVVLDGGQVVTEYPSYVSTVRTPKTGIGVSKDGRMLILATVDGRSSKSTGLSPAELGKLLRRNGAYDGLAMDSGGSAQMYVAGRGIVNTPSDGRERPVANALMIQANRKKK